MSRIIYRGDEELCERKTILLSKIVEKVNAHKVKQSVTKWRFSNVDTTTQVQISVQGWLRAEYVYGYLYQKFYL